MLLLTTMNLSVHVRTIYIALAVLVADLAAAGKPYVEFGRLPPHCDADGGQCVRGVFASSLLQSQKGLRTIQAIPGLQDDITPPLSVQPQLPVQQVVPPVQPWAGTGSAGMVQPMMVPQAPATPQFTQPVLLQGQPSMQQSPQLFLQPSSFQVEEAVFPESMMQQAAMNTASEAALGAASAGAQAAELSPLESQLLPRLQALQSQVSGLQRQLQSEEVQVGSVVSTAAQQLRQAQTAGANLAAENQAAVLSANQAKQVAEEAVKAAEKAGSEAQAFEKKFEAMKAQRDEAEKHAAEAAQATREAEARESSLAKRAASALRQSAKEIERLAESKARDDAQLRKTEAELRQLQTEVAQAQVAWQQAFPQGIPPGEQAQVGEELARAFQAESNRAAPGAGAGLAAQ